MQIGFVEIICYNALVWHGANTPNYMLLLTPHFSRHLLLIFKIVLFSQTDQASITKVNFERVNWATEQLSGSSSTITASTRTSSKIQVSWVQNNDLSTWALFEQIKVPGQITALLFLSHRTVYISCPHVLGKLLTVTCTGLEIRAVVCSQPLRQYPRWPGPT